MEIKAAKKSMIFKTFIVNSISEDYKTRTRI